MKIKKPQVQEAEPCDWISIDDLVLSRYRSKLQTRPEFAPTTPLDLWTDSRAPSASSAHKAMYGGASPASQRNEAQPPAWLW
jgi:hypothetical protein